MDQPTAATPTLQQACTALWLATLALMAAFMRTAAPAHRYLLAQRIARNFETLRAQECYGDAARARFARLARRWSRKAQMLAPSRARRQGVFTRLQQRLFAR